MNKSVLVHLKNKYPEAVIVAGESAIDVYGATGEHMIAYRKDGAGGWVDQSEALGCSHRFCLAPIPKGARVHKLHKDGSIGLDDKHEDRRKQLKEFQCDKSGKVKSMEELKSDGFKFGADGEMLSGPSKANA